MRDLKIRSAENSTPSQRFESSVDADETLFDDVDLEGKTQNKSFGTTVATRIAMRNAMRNDWTYCIEQDLAVGNIRVSPESNEDSQDPETHTSLEGSQSSKKASNPTSPASSLNSFFSCNGSVNFSESSRDSDPNVFDVTNEKQEAGTVGQSSTGGKGASQGYKSQQQKSAKKKRKSQQKNRW